MTGPAQFAIDGKDETAWGIDAGPGLRNQSRKAVFNLATPVSYPEGHDSDHFPVAEPRRVELRRQPEQQSRQVPVVGYRHRQCHSGSFAEERTGHTLYSRRASVLPRRCRPCLATGAPLFRSGSGERRDCASLARVSRRVGATSVCNPSRPRETHILTRGDFLQPTALVQPGVPAFLHPLPRMIPGKTANLRGSLLRAGWRRGIPLPRRAPSSTGCGRPTLELGLSRPAKISEPRPSNLRIRNYWIGWRSISWIRVGVEEAPPADCHLGNLPAVLQSDARIAGEATPTTGCSPAARVFVSTRRWCATSH